MAGRSSRRHGSARWVLGAAVAPVIALLGAHNGALAETKTFSDTQSDWLTATNWSPTGVPTSADSAVISLGTSAMSLTSDLTIQRILFSDASSRILGNATEGDGDANLTLTGAGGGPLIDVTSTGSFTINGPNIDPLGEGSGRLDVKFLSDGDLNVTHSAAK